MPNRFSNTHTPRTTGEVSIPLEVAVNTLACPNRPTALGVVEFYFAEFPAFYAFYAV